jgi:hypothetical protein
LNRSFSLYPWNGCRPVSMTNIITPKLQQSALFP